MKKLKGKASTEDKNIHRLNPERKKRRTFCGGKTGNS